MSTSDELEDAKYVTVYWVILAVGSLALLLGGLIALTEWGALGHGGVATLADSGTAGTLAVVVWAASVLLAIFVAMVQGRWGWVIAALLMPLAQIAFGVCGLSDVHYERHRQVGQYLTPEALAQAEAEHDGGRRAP